MGQNQKHVKDLKTDSGHGEEVDGDQLLGVILQECAPGLRWRFAAAHHVFADAALTDVDAEFEQFAMEALYDAIIGSPDPLKKASKDKHVLLIVTDGEDNTSHNSLERTIREIQKTETVIYTIGLLSQESKKSAKKAKRALEQIAQASGGVAYFPENVADVHNLCDQVAHDICNQYTLAYYPTNTRRDGTFRAVTVSVIPPRGRGKLIARTRNGYYAPSESAAAGN
jgi:Ca-activated chloride channel family protein